MPVGLNHGRVARGVYAAMNALERYLGTWGLDEPVGV
jgi:hypothetical protein